MSSASAPNAQTSQDQPRLDVGKFRRVAALLGSDQAGERANALDACNRMLRAVGVHWLDFVDAWRRAEIADEAAAALLAENAALRDEIDQLRAENSRGTAVALWSDVGAKPSDTRRVAEWALDLHRRRVIWLSPGFEVPFLTRCSTWVGRLTPKMQPIFRRIIDQVVADSGQAPPTS